MKRILRLSVCAALSAAVLPTGCTRNPDKVKIGYMPYTSNLPIFVAMEKGYFKAEGLDVEGVKFSSSKEAMDALLSGKIDAEGTIGLSTLFAIEAASPGQVRFYLPCVESDSKYANYLLVRKGSRITTVQQLKGKKVGTYTGTTQLLYLNLLLQKFGLDPKRDVTIIQVSPQVEVEALGTGQFDALFTIEPSATIALEKGVADLLVANPRGKYIMTPFPAGAFPIASSFWQSRPKDAKRIYRALDKAIDFIRSNENDARMLLVKYTGLEETIALKGGMYEWWKPNETKVEPMQGLADILSQYGEIKTKVDVGRMVLTEAELR